MPVGKNRQWLQKHFSDPWVKQAQQAGYRSRAACKLLELQKRYRLIRRGDVVVDLGAAPGGWCQVAAPLVGREGKVIALDRLPIAPVPHAEVLQGDFSDAAVVSQLRELLAGRQVNLVLCDMCPDLGGIGVTDQARAMALCELALVFAKSVLNENGIFLIKVFQGEGFESFLKEMRSLFPSVMIRKPQASRNRSREVYLLAGCGRKQHNLRKERGFQCE